MALIGFLLLAAAAIVGIDVAYENMDVGVDVAAFGSTSTTNLGVLFVGGVLTALVACLGIMLLRDGAAISARRRSERKERDAERDRLRAEVEERKARERQAQVDLRDRPVEREVGATDVSAGGIEGRSSTEGERRSGLTHRGRR